MDEENTSGETEQAAAVQQEAAEETGASPETTNPNANDFRGMRGALKDMKDENSALRSEIMKMTQSFTQTQEKQVDPFDGRDETDFLTIAEQRQREKALRNDMLQEKTTLETKTKVIGFLSSHPDYEETMNEYGKTLPLKLRTFLLKHPGDPDAMEAAYETCKDGPKYIRDHAVNAEHDNAKRAAEKYG